MAQLILEPMNNAAAWRALAPDGVTASREVAMVSETGQVRHGTDRRSGRITASAAASGHLLRRTLPSAVDLTAYRELRLWLHASRAALGTPTQPYFLEVRLGSAALPVGVPGNTWHRFLPVSGPAMWELHRLSLADLAPAARSAVNTLQLRCQGGVPFTCYLDDVLAVREELVPDVEAALIARLDGQLPIGNALVRAVVHSPNDAAPPMPYLRLTQLRIEYSDTRTPSTPVRSDFSSTGYILRPAGFAYDLWYQVEAFSRRRDEEALMLDFALERMPPRGELIVNGAPLPLEMAALPATELVGGGRGERAALLYRVLARKDAGVATPTHGVDTVLIEADQKVA